MGENKYMFLLFFFEILIVQFCCFLRTSWNQNKHYFHFFFLFVATLVHTLIAARVCVRLLKSDCFAVVIMNDGTACERSDTLTVAAPGLAESRCKPPDASTPLPYASINFVNAWARLATPRLEAEPTEYEQPKST